MKKFNLIILLLALMLVTTLPVAAGYEYQEVDDGVYEVTFFHTGDLDANAVYLAGDMNDWPSSHPEWEMELVDGRWELTIELEEGIYEYKFVVNGSNWIVDPDVEERRPDDHGGQNSLLSLLDTSLPGELNLSGDLKTELIYQGQTEEFNLLNEILLRADGIFYRELETDNEELVYQPAVKYDGRIGFVQDITDLGNNELADEAALDEVYLDHAQATYLHDLADLSLEANRADMTDSPDHIGLLASSENPESDSRRIKIDSNKYLNLEAALTEYTADITDSSSKEQYLAYLNLTESLLDDSLELGSTGIYNEFVVDDQEHQGAATMASVFAQYNFTDQFNLRAQYANSSRYVADLLRFTFDPAEFDIRADEIAEVYIVGDFDVNESSWEEDDKDNKIKLEQEDGIWVGDAGQADEIIELGTEFKFHIYPTDKGAIENYEWFDWNENGFSWAGIDLYEDESDDDDFEVSVDEIGKTVVMDFEFEDQRGHLYKVELDYNIVDQMRSLEESIAAGDDITVYQAEFNLGLLGIEDKVYLLRSDDDLEADSNQIYADARYNLTKNIELATDLVYEQDFNWEEDKKQQAELSLNSVLLDEQLDLNSSFLFKDGIDDDDEEAGFQELNRRFKVESTLREPIVGIDHTSLNLELDSGAESDFDDTKNIQDLFAEVQIGALPLTDYLKLNTNQRLDAEVADYFAEISLDLPLEQIDYINAELFFADDEQTFTDNALRYKLEGRLHQLPIIETYLTHLSGEFEVDEDSIKEQEEYDDEDDIDWTKRAQIATMLDLPGLEQFHGLTAELDLEQIKEDEIDYDQMDDDYNAQYIVKGEAVNWSTTLTFLTGYDLTEAVTTNLTLKSDLNHGNLISEYEDDALLAELLWDFGPARELSLSYNRRDEDEGEDYLEVLHQLSF